MKRIFCIVLTAVIGTWSAFSQDLTSGLGPNGKWGFVDNRGNFTIAPEYDEVQQEFTASGIACVKKGGKTFFINTSGKAISDKFTWADIFSEDGLCKVNIGGELDDNGNVSGGSYGFVGVSGEYIVKPVYEYIGAFNAFGLALVNNGCSISEDGTPKGGKFGYIDTGGNIVVPIQFEFAGEFDRQGMCWVNKGGKMFEGDKTVDAQMNAFAAREKNVKKLAAKREELEDAITGGKRDPFGRKAVGGLYGMYSKDGSVVINVLYNKIGSFAEGLCRVQTKKGFGYVNASAAEIVPCTYLDAAPQFKEGRAWVKALVNKEPLYGYIDTDGKTVINCIYRNVTDFDNDAAIVSKPGSVDKKGNVTSLTKYGLIDRNGKALTEFQYDLISKKDDLLYCKQSGKYCFISENGKEITPAVILEAKTFADGQVRVRVSSADAAKAPKGGRLVSSGNAQKDKGKWLVIDNEGTVVSDSYDKIGELSYGIYAVENAGLSGYMDKSGKIVIPLNYAKGHPFSNGFAPVMNSEMKWGYVDLSGKETVPCQFENVSGQIPEGVGIIMKDGKWGGISPLTGETLIPFQLASEKDAIAVAGTLFVEFGREALPDRSIDLYNARTKGNKSRFSITEVIGEEYWDY